MEGEQFVDEIKRMSGIFAKIGKGTKSMRQSKMESGIKWEGQREYILLPPLAFLLVFFDYKISILEIWAYYGIYLTLVN